MMGVEPEGHDAPDFQASIETVEVGPELFRAVLVLSMGGAESDEAVRIELAGEHPSPEEARLAAREAISAMAGHPP